MNVTSGPISFVENTLQMFDRALEGENVANDAPRSALVSGKQATKAAANQQQIKTET